MILLATANGSIFEEDTVHTRPVSLIRWAAAALALFLLPAAASAQPFGGWRIFDRPIEGYIRIPHSPALNPTGAITIEGWINVTDGGSCSSIIGKGYQTAWWIGICGTTLRSYLDGTSSLRDGGRLAPNEWTHFAVTYDGANRRHYINGELVATFAQTGLLDTNTEQVRIGSDVNYAPFSPVGTINEIRLWNVARTLAQIRSTINVPVTAAQPGLVAVWAGGGPNDVVGPHDGVIVDSVPALTFPVTGVPCATVADNLCLNDRFQVTIDWRTSPPTTVPPSGGQGMVAPLITAQSGIFWFFSATNWEVMVKVLNGCGLNNRWWVFSAATTNVSYRVEVFDRLRGVNKVYFNYPGPPAPAVTDTNALATCP